jgi:S1-C subfamily serine protease
VTLLIGGPGIAKTPPQQPPATGGSGKVKSSTGFFISQDGLLLTSAHGVEGCAAISVWPHGGATRRARLIAADQRLDVALLSTDSPVPRYAAAPERGSPRIGEQIVALGFGVHVKEPLIPVIIEGSFAGDGRTPSGDPIFVIHAKVPEGASGGSVVDANGSLIGMVIGYYADEPDMGVVLSIGDIAEFLGRRGIWLAPGPLLDSRSERLNDFLVNMSALIQCAPRQTRAAAD